MDVLYIIISIYAIVSYVKNDYVLFLLSLFAIMSKLFMLDQFESSLYHYDYGLILTLFILPKAYLINKRKGLNRNPYDKWVKYIVVFYVLELLITIITHAEGVSWALKVLRIPLIILIYYVFKTIPIRAWNRFFRYGLYITIVQGVLFLLQFVGVHLITGYNEEYMNSMQYGAAMNIPTLLYFYIFYCLKNENIKYRYVFVLFFIFICLMTFVRGLIIALAVSMVCYLITNKINRQTIFIAVLAIIAIPTTQKFIDVKSTINGSTSSDIEEVLSGNLRNIDAQSGTFSFRIAMLVERFEYLEQNPSFLPFGIGMIHEFSPTCHNRFGFKIGTINQSTYTGRCQIESGDIAWVPTLLRYGIIGVIIHIILFIIVFLDSFRRTDGWQFLGSVFVIILLTSLNGPLFESSPMLYKVAIYISILSLTYKDSKALLK